MSASQDGLSELIERFGQGKTTRRDFLQGAALLGFSMPAAYSLLGTLGQGPATNPGAQPDAMPAPKARSVGAVGPDTVVFATPSTPINLDHEYTSGIAAVQAVPQVIETGLEWEYVPGDWDPEVKVPDYKSLKSRYFDSWEISEDGLTVTIRLKEGIKSYYGNEMTAHDYKWSKDRGCSEIAAVTSFYNALMTYSCGGEGGAAESESVQVIDDYTFSVTTEQPNAFLLLIHVNGWGEPIHDSTECKKHATDEDPWAVEWVKTNGGGFGAYAPVKWEPGVEVVYERNESYWDGPPPLKKVIQREVPDRTSRVALLSRGEVDVAMELLPRERVALEQIPGIVHRSAKGNWFVQVLMNNEMPPFDNKKVRQAINYAMPRDEIISAVFAGQARNAVSPVTDIYPGVLELGSWPNDPEKAKELLEEAGHAEGFETTLTYSTAVPHQEDIAILLRDGLGNIGVQLQLERASASVFGEHYFANDRPMIFTEELAIQPDPVYQMFLYYHSESFINHSLYQNPEVDRVLREGTATVDDTRRLELGEEAQKLIWDDCPWGWGWYLGWHVMCQDYVKGWVWMSENSEKWAALAFA